MEQKTCGMKNATNADVQRKHGEKEKLKKIQQLPAASLI